MGAPSVPYWQMASPSPRIRGGAQGLVTTIRYRVKWEDAFTFFNDVLGILDGNPWQWPASLNMRAYDAEIEPIGVSADVASQTKDGSFGSSPGEFYEFAIVSVTFGSQATLATLPFTGDTINIPPADQFDPANPIEMSTYEINYGTEQIKLPGGALKWSGTKADGSLQTLPLGLRPPESGSVYWRVPTFELTITLNNCLFVDSSIVIEKMGRVNLSQEFTICAPETLLLDGLKTTRRGMSDGVAILDVALFYKWKSIGWNVTLGSDGNLYRYEESPGVLLYSGLNIHPNAIMPPPTRWKPYDFNGIPGR